MAEQAYRDNKIPYSRTLLEDCEKAMMDCVYMEKEIKRRWLIASAMAAEKDRSVFLSKRIFIVFCGGSAASSIIM